MITCAQGVQSWAGVLLPHLDHTHGWRTTEPRKRAVPFHRAGAGEVHHDQCILVDDMNHVATGGKGAWMQKNAGAAVSGTSSRPPTPLVPHPCPVRNLRSSFPRQT